MTFQPAINASGSLLATPAIGAPNAAPATDASLFQSLLAGANAETPIISVTPIATPQTANAGNVLALLLQTTDAQPAVQATQTPAMTTTDEAATTAPTAPAPIFAIEPTADIAGSTPPLAVKPQTKSAAPTPSIAPGAEPVSPQTAAPQTAIQISTIVPAPSEIPGAVEQTDQAAPAPLQAATPAPDAAQAIIFAPFAAQAATAPSASAATPAKDASAPVDADTTTQTGPFKKTTFAAQTKAEPSNGGFAKLAGDALAAPQAQTPARADSAQPGVASPITGFDAPRPATDAISTPVARALHGAAAMQVAQHVARRFDGQSANFEVRLDPAELGRVDVKITVDHDKRVTAAVFADSAQTLSDLRGAARDIERALNEAGLDLAQGGLSFDLNQRQADDDQFDAAPYANAAAGEGEAKTVTIAARPFGMERWSSSGVDVWA